MTLIDVLATDAVCPGIEAVTRDEALAEVLESLSAKAHIEHKDVKPILRSLIEREELGSTAIGKGIAVPHGKSKNLDRIFVTFARSLSGVEFKALDGEPVFAMFVVLCPVERPPEYLQIMETISRIIQNPDFLPFIKNVDGAAQIVEIIEEMS